MSATVIAAATAVVTAIVTGAASVMMATLPETRDVLAPIFDGNSENTIAIFSMTASLPMLAVLTVLSLAGRD